MPFGLSTLLGEPFSIDENGLRGYIGPTPNSFSPLNFSLFSTTKQV